MKRMKGFTLIEMLIVIAIISILCSVVFNLASFSIRYHHEHLYTGNQVEKIRLFLQKMDRYCLEEVKVEYSDHKVVCYHKDQTERWFIQDAKLMVDDGKGPITWVEGIQKFDLEQKDELLTCSIKTMIIPEYGKTERAYHYTFSTRKIRRIEDE